MMTEVEVNDSERNRKFDEESDEERLLADDGDEIGDHDTTGDANIDPKLIWKAIQDLEKKFDLLAGTSNTGITDASLKLKMLQTKTDKSKNDSETPLGPSRKKQKKFLSSDDEASDDSEREVTAMFEVEEQDGDSSE